MKLAKPVMDGLSVRRGLKAVISAVSCSLLGGMAWQYLYIDRKRKTYQDFYATYDIHKEFETMRQKGLFDSC